MSEGRQDAGEQGGGNGERRERVLFFRSGGEVFAVGVASVAEVVVAAGLTPVPMAPPEVLGVVNHRGKIFTVVDFARLAGLPGGDRGERQAVFLQRPDMSVGFAASVEGIEWVPSRLLEGQGGDGGGREFLRGVLDFEGRVAGVVDPERLADTVARLAEAPAV